MGNAKKRGAGATKEVGGRVKKNVGRLIGSERMEAEGRAQELAGRDQKESAKRAERVKGEIEEKTGALQRSAGELLDDEEVEARGRIRETRGALRKHANR
jgi:uncharacterized protein YjbJ (UPF0337 family)